MATCKSEHIKIIFVRESDKKIHIHSSGNIVRTKGGTRRCDFTTNLTNSLHRVPLTGPSIQKQH